MSVSKLYIKKTVCKIISESIVLVILVISHSHEGETNFSLFLFLLSTLNSDNNTKKNWNLNNLKKKTGDVNKIHGFFNKK